MASSDSSCLSKSDLEKGHSGGNLGFTRTFSASSFMDEANWVVMLRVGLDSAECWCWSKGNRRGDVETKAVVEIVLNDRRARRLLRIVEM